MRLEAALGDAFDPCDPTGLAEIRTHATWIARRELRQLQLLFEERYSKAIVDLGGAARLADYALVETGRLFQGRQDELRNLWAYLTSIIHNQAVAEADAALRTQAPAARAHWVRTRNVLKRLDQERPDLSYEQRERMALAEADALVGRHGFAERDPDPATVDRIPTLELGYAVVDLAGVVEMIDRLVAGSCFTSTDQATWEAFKAADFDAGQIDWEAFAVTRHAGRNRLLALLKKLRGLVLDWRS